MTRCASSVGDGEVTEERDNFYRIATYFARASRRHNEVSDDLPVPYAVPVRPMCNWVRDSPRGDDS